ncbi:hypothetical protein AMATHDRAFT_63274 [Amanita thiersii Skay4041]|uniref:Cytochrome P450 n=1 Tax=Amanita thiersii Skay4041 TaxID=703135 RepID=A0A2A9NJB5_9AGAR|nr:hypothetical protein AMATHDRAFT_63274 [Amanita thiersii Skay4041]
MSFNAIQTAYAVIALVLGVLLYSSFTVGPVPPGPPPKIISGNAHQLPKSEYWKTYRQWSLNYGPVIFFRIFSRKYVILNDIKSAMDLLESRSAQYSDRPQVWMYKELVGRKLAVFNISSQHPRFKIYRKLLHSGLNPRAVQTYHNLIQEEARKLLRALAKAPEDFIVHFRQNAGAVILNLAYGWSVTGTRDRFVVLMEEAFLLHSQITKPGKWLVDSFPILRFVPPWFPGAGFRRKAEEFKRELSLVDTAPFVWAKEQIESGNFTPSFTSHHLLPEDGHTPDDEEQDIIKWCSGGLYAGGADTIVASMTAFIAAMVLYPDVQRRAQLEIESIIGNEQAKAEDISRLPFILAIMKETFRWAPPAPLGLPHRVIEDDVYMGYHIPKGTTVMANIWAIAHDTTLYPDPDAFKPDRFLSSDKEPQLDPRRFVFGFGRRVCPGSDFAETSLFLNIVNILKTFDIQKAVDSNGQEITPEIEFTTTVTSHIKPFPCHIVPRSSADLSSDWI